MGLQQLGYSLRMVSLLQQLNDDALKGGNREYAFTSLVHPDNIDTPPQVAKTLNMAARHVVKMSHNKRISL